MMIHQSTPDLHRSHLIIMTFVILVTVLATPSWAERPMVLEINQLTVNDTKPSGKRWDFGLGKISKPDLIIIVSLDEEQLLITKKCKDSFSCTFNRSAPFMITGEQILRFKVIDKDLKRDDTIDLLTVRINEGDAHQKQELKLAGKSTSMLSVTLRPFIEPKPTQNTPSQPSVSPESKPQLTQPTK